jgi:TRAP-type C4-dicarboxylate transport system permease small subunit
MPRFAGLTALSMSKGFAGCAVASRMRGKEVSFILRPPVVGSYRVDPAGHVPVKGGVKGMGMGEITKTFARGVHLINSALRYVCMTLLFFMMVLGTCDVMGRYLFNKPILGTFEIFEILLPAIVLLGLGYTQGNNAHVRVELFISHLPARKQTILNFVSNGCALFISILILWRGWLLTTTYWRMGRTIPTIDVPMFLPQLLVPIGALMLIFVLIVQMVQYIIQLSERR